MTTINIDDKETDERAAGRWLTIGWTLLADWGDALDVPRKLQSRARPLAPCDLHTEYKRAAQAERTELCLGLAEDDLTMEERAEVQVDLASFEERAALTRDWLTQSREALAHRVAMLEDYAIEAVRDSLPQLALRDPTARADALGVEEVFTEILTAWYEDRAQGCEDCIGTGQVTSRHELRRRKAAAS